MGFLGAAAPAVVSGVATLGGALLGSRSEKKATDAQLQANREAMRYQREQDARMERQWAAAWDAYNQRRAMLMRRYGLEVPELQNPYIGESLGSIAVGRPAATAVPRAPMPSGRGASLGDLVEWGVRDA